MTVLSSARASLAVLAVVTFTAFASEIRVVDARGVEIALARPAARIVTLAPSLAEIAFAAGAGSKVVGVSSFSDYPDAARRLPVVASQGRVNLEALVALQPDLVIAWRSGNPARDVARVERLGIPVFILEPRTFADIARALRSVGRMAGTDEIAESAAQTFERKAASLAGADAAKRTSVFFELWHAPLIAVGGAHLIGEIVRRCGGRNVFENVPVLAPRVAREALLTSDPAVILTTAAPGRAAALRLWADSPMLKAVRSEHVYALDPSLITRQGPRVVDGARDVCDALRAAEQSG